MQDLKTMLETYKADMEGRIQMYRVALQALDLTPAEEKGYVVQVDGYTVRFELVDGEYKNPMICPPHCCTQFTKEEADKMARSVVNGNGQNGTSIFVTDAIQKVLQSEQEMLKIIDAKLAEK